MSKVKLGIIGIGNMGSGHVNNLTDGKCPEIELVAVADVKPERLEWAKGRNANVTCFNTAEEMLDAFLSAAGRGKRRMPPPAQAFHGIVARKIVPVSTKIAYVLRKLYTRSNVSYQSLFKHAESKSDLVATFLALLELIKSKRISVEGEGSEQTVQMRPPEEWDTTVPEEFDEENEHV